MIRTERLILRHWCEDDAEALYRYACDPDIGPVAGWVPHPSVEYSREIIRTVFSGPEIYAVVPTGSSEPVGCCGIVFSETVPVSDIIPASDGNRREAEIGYWIAKSFWGRGLIPEAVSALLSRAFRDLGLDAVWCVHYDGNAKSKRVCEKCGFSYHHTNPDVPTLLGDHRIEHFYLMTREDWKFQL